MESHKHNDKMNRLAELIQQIEIHIPRQEFINRKVSAASVGWHIEHTLLTISVIIDALQKSKPEDYRWKFNFLRTLILTTRKIPRGRAQSPKAVRPQAIFNTETLHTHVSLIKNKMIVLDSLLRNHHFEHPFFGKLNLKPAIKFIELHTRHDIHIINDILA